MTETTETRAARGEKGLSRRDLLTVAGYGAVAALATALMPVNAFAAADDAAKAIAKLTAGAKPGQGKITLKLPEIAENGNTVPVTIIIDSPMSGSSHVKKVALLADGNPTPNVASFELSPATGKAEIAVRIRLAKTQNVIAVAQMSDGSYQMASKQIKVTIGGCGG